MAASSSLAALQAAFPAHAPALVEMEGLYARRQWYQLAARLLEFVSLADNSAGDNFLQLYTNFVAPIARDLQPLQLARIAARVATQYYPSRPFVADELARATALMQDVLTKYATNKTGDDRIDDAALVCRMELTSLKLKTTQAMVASGTADVAAVNALLDEAKKELAADATQLTKLMEGGVDPVVGSVYYQTAAEYYKLRGPAHKFYESSLMFLGITPLDTLTPETQLAMAVDIALAALVGDGVYNFGEVNAHPILHSLTGSPHAWLIDLLRAFQTGDIDAFNAVVAANSAAFNAQPALAASEAVIKEKITLLAVMELAARKPASERSITFAEIAAETRLPLEQVDWLLMRALSLGLIAGKMDGVDGVVHVSFVRPRVLDTTQITTLRDNIRSWRTTANTMLTFMEEKSHDIFA